MISSIDVAKKAGVSQSTVSRVLNNPDSVKPKTKEKVLRAMEKLNYYPNLIARSLVTRSSRTIALVSGTLKNGFFVETTHSIVHLAKMRGYNVIVYFEDEDTMPNFLDYSLGYNVDGILLSLIKLEDPVQDRIMQAKLPCVFFNRKPKNGGNYVVMDNISAAKLAARHLLEFGHRRIAVISGKTGISTMNERRLGFEETMREAGLSIEPELVHYINASSDEVKKVTNFLLSLSKPPTAIVCMTDTMALTCMDTIISKGLSIPEDISLIGFDDINISSHHAVQLTTIGHNGADMGALAAKMLFELLENPKSSNEADFNQIVLPAKLIVRRTTGPVKRIKSLY